MLNFSVLRFVEGKAKCLEDVIFAAHRKAVLLTCEPSKFPGSELLLPHRQEDVVVQLEGVGRLWDHVALARRMHHAEVFPALMLAVLRPVHLLRQVLHK